MTDPFRSAERPRRRVEFTAGGDASSGRSAALDPPACDPPACDVHWAELSALVTRAEANRAEMSRLQAERAEVCAAALDLVALRVAQRDAARVARAGTPRAYSGHGSRVASTVEFGDSIPLREILAELSAALRVGERTLSNLLGDGAALVGTYSATLEALRTGRIDERHAAAIIDAGAALDPEHRAEYEALILPVAEAETAPAVREYAKVVAARIQPDILVENQRRALAERRVRAFDLGDGLARLLLDAPAALVHGIFERVTDLAGALDAGAPGDSAAPDDTALPGDGPAPLDAGAQLDGASPGPVPVGRAMPSFDGDPARAALPSPRATSPDARTRRDAGIADDVHTPLPRYPPSLVDGLHRKR